jgi:hypothetical protein
VAPGVFLSILEKQPLTLTSISESSQVGIDAHSKKLNMEYVHAQSSKISHDELEELTHPSKYSPRIGAKVALNLLASETKIENRSDNREGIEGIVNQWKYFRSEIEKDFRLSRRLRSVSSEALAEIILEVS